MMNSRHLPAGQSLQGDLGPASGPGGMGAGGGAGNGGGRRGGRQSQHYYQNVNHHQYMNHHYAGSPYAMNPYATPAPYQPHYMQPQYQTGGMPPQAYMNFPPARSPPSMAPAQQFVPMGPPNYARLQNDPSLQYQAHHPQAPVPAAPPIPPQTPSSTHSAYIAPPPAMSSAMAPALTPPVVQSSEPPPTQHQPYPHPETATEPAPQPPTPAASSVFSPPSQPVFSPSAKLPWYSCPEESFPTKTSRSKRRRRTPLNTSVEVVNLVERGNNASANELEQTAPDASANPSGEHIATTEDDQAVATTPKARPSKTVADQPPPVSATPSIPEHPSDYAVSSPPTTPGSALDDSAFQTTPRAGSKPVSRPAVPAVPVLPALPKAGFKDADVRPAATGASEPSQVETTSARQSATAQINGAAADGASAQDTESASTPAQAPSPAPAPAPMKPKLWTGLFAKASPAAKASAAGTNAQGNASNGAAAAASAGPDDAQTGSGFVRANANSLAEALQAYRVGGGEKIPFLEPRGLVNTGNMCYMNSILQVLVFCVPFYQFLDQVSKKAAYSFKSETPLLDAIIMFFREFKVIDSATSADMLRKRLKSEELEQYGEPFTPEFVYEAIKTLPRFASMRRGHQQDAEEFLGFLLEGLHDECARVMRNAPVSTSTSTMPSPTVSSRNTEIGDAGDDWLEVGPRQRPAVTRSSGHSNVSTPITKIFGGQLRSELRVPGMKTSVTLEPYQPLQLDIGAPDIRNIVDALRRITRPESLHGNFNSPHGKDVKATKQVFIESIPPVLILHLKRFQFDAEGHGTVKIWKKVGYPLELELPAEVLARQKRNTVMAEGVPRYRLITVVYHHGKNASGGHYTVDVRRQDGQEWIRMDDTVIRRVRSEEVAEGGAEEDAPKPGAGADAHKENGAVGNRFGAMNDEDAGDDEGWKPAPAGGKKWSSVVNGGASTTTTANGSKGKATKDSIKDNKVAYLLFYERI